VFGVIEDVVRSADGRLFALDSQLCMLHVISGEGEYLGSIGRAGEGPGELEFPTMVSLSEDGVLCVNDLDAGKIVFFAADGSPLGDLHPEVNGVDRTELVTSHPVSGGFVLRARTRHFTENSLTEREFVGLFDDAGKLVVTGAEREKIRRRGEPFVYDQAIESGFYVLDIAKEKLILVSESYRDYRIDLYDLQGVRKIVIEREYQPVRRSSQEVEEERRYWEGYYRQRPNTIIRIAECYRTIEAAAVRPDGEIWVATSRSWRDLPDGVADVRDVFDASGRFVRQARLCKEDLSPEDDYLIYYDDWVLVSIAGHAADVAAVGGGGALSDYDSDAPDRIPCIAWCEIVPVK
jgi:hypothetical protein